MYRGAAGGLAGRLALTPLLPMVYVRPDGRFRPAPPATGERSVPKACPPCLPACLPPGERMKKGGPDCSGPPRFRLPACLPADQASAFAALRSAALSRHL
jgi:hypothetical protein